MTVLSPATNPAIPYDTSVVYSLKATASGYSLWTIQSFNIGTASGPDDTSDWFYKYGKYDNWDTGARAPLPPVAGSYLGSLQGGMLFRIQKILYQAYRTKRGANATPEGTYLCAQVGMLAGALAGTDGYIWLVYNADPIFEVHAPACAIKAYEHTEITLTCESQSEPLILAHTCEDKPYVLAEKVIGASWYIPPPGNSGQLAGNRRVYDKKDKPRNIVGVAARDEVHARLELDIEAPPPAADTQPVAEVLFHTTKKHKQNHPIVLPLAQSSPGQYQARVTAGDFRDILQQPAQVFTIEHTYSDEDVSATAILDDKNVPLVVGAMFADQGSPLASKRLVKKLVSEDATRRWLVIEKKGEKRRFEIAIKKKTTGSTKIEIITASAQAARLNEAFVRATVAKQLTATGLKLTSENLAYPLLQHAVYFLPDAFGSSLFIDKGGSVREAYPRGLKPLALTQFNQFVADNEDDVKDDIQDWYDEIRDDARQWVIDRATDLALKHIPSLVSYVVTGTTLLLDTLLLPVADDLASDLADWAEDKWNGFKARTRDVLRTHQLDDLACQLDGMPVFAARPQRLKLIRGSHLGALGIPTYHGLDSKFLSADFPELFFDSACENRPVQQVVFSDIAYDWRMPSDHNQSDIADRFRFLRDAACAIQHAHERAELEVLRVDLGSSYVLDLWDEHMLVGAIDDLQAGKLPSVLHEGFKDALGISDPESLTILSGATAGSWIAKKTTVEQYQIALDRFRFQVSQSDVEPQRRLYPFLARRPAVAAHGLGSVILRGLVSLDNPLRHRIGQAFFLDAEFWGSPRGMLGFLTGDLFDNLLSVPIYRQAWQQVALTWPAMYYMWPDTDYRAVVGEQIGWSMLDPASFGMQGYNDQLRILADDYRQRCRNANPLVQVPSYVFHTDGLRTPIDERPNVDVQQLQDFFDEAQDALGSSAGALVSLVLFWFTGVNINDILDDAQVVVDMFDMPRVPIRAPLGDEARTTITQIADVGDWSSAVVMRPTPEDPSSADASRNKWIWRRIFKVLCRAPLATRPPGARYLDPDGDRPDAYDALAWPESADQDALLARLRDHVLAIAEERWQAVAASNREITSVNQNTTLVKNYSHGSNWDGLDDAVLHIKCHNGQLEVDTWQRPATSGSDVTPMASKFLSAGEEWLTGMAKESYESTDKIFSVRVTPDGSSDYTIDFRSFEEDLLP